MRKIWLVLLTGVIAFLAACGGSSKPVTVAVSPSAQQTVDQGQAVTFTATVANDSSNSGVTWTVSGGGTLSNSTSTSVTYTAPATVTTATTATLTATSIKTGTVAATISITVNPTPAVTISAVAAGVAGTPYSATLTASGGTAPLTWTVATGSLPPGLTLTNAGIITGSPTAPGTASFTVKVTDSAATPLSATSQQLSIAITAAPLVLTAPTLTNAIQGTAYTSGAFSTIGGTGAITFSATGLPAGLGINAATGVISGTPTVAGTSANVVVTATDSGTGAFLQTRTSGSLSLTVLPKLTLAAIAPLTTIQNGSSISIAPAASGGVTAYTWNASGLPAGVSINSGTGAITGTPTASGSFNATITVKDNGAPQQSTTGTLALTVVAPLAITTTSLSSAIQNTAYTSAALASSGGTGAITWSAVSGLPSTLSINAVTGVISGTPTAAGGPFSVVVKATDSGTGALTQTTTTTLSFTVIAQLQATASSTFPAGVANKPYAQGTAQLQASGGTAPYNWTATGLPAGLTATTSTTAGVNVQLSGTPTAAGTSTVTFNVTDSGTGTLQQQSTVTFSLTILPQLLISTTTLPNGLVSSPYPVTTIASTGGTTPLTWSATGLPSGLIINTATGTISGTPTTTVGSPFAVSITATDSGTGSTLQTATRQYSLTVAAALAITTTTLPNASVNTPYTASLQSSGGIAPVTWSVVSGTLPAGLILNSTTGAINGTPTVSGTSNFTIKATDSATPAEVVTQALSITVNAVPLAILTTSLPNATVNAAYSTNLNSTGGTGAITWTAQGALPAGLTLNGTTGQISGTPTTAGTVGFSVTATDSGTPQQTKTQALGITTNAAVPTLTIGTTSLPNGTAGTTYSQNLNVSGGTSPYVASVTAGALPGGLTVNNNGTISGTPTASGTFSFTVQFKDSGTPQQTASQALTLTVTASVLTIQSNASITGEVSLPFLHQMSVSGGTGPYTWSVTPSTPALPAGITLNASTGAITGAPTTAATTTVTMQVQDANLNTATQSLVITVNPARTNAKNAELSGQYAFLLTGFDSGGNPVTTAGEFTADGNGNITSGQFDQNGTAKTASQNTTLIASTYSVGADNRGKVILATSGGNATFVFALSQITAGVAHGGHILRFDFSGQRLTGILALQDTTSFSTASLAGGYTFGITGFKQNANQHAGVIGEMQFDSAGNMTSGEALSSNPGGPFTPVALNSGTYTIASSGRGTETFTVAGNTTPTNLVFYAVSASQLFVVSADPASGTSANYLLSGQALRQTVANGSFTNATLNGVAVISITRLQQNTTGNTAGVTIGLVTANGAGGATFSADENSGGTLTAQSQTGITYSVATNGRVTLTGTGNNAPTFYLVGNNQGFTLINNGSVDAGSFEPQTTSTFNALSLNGAYALGGVNPLITGVSDANDIAGVITADGVASLTATVDIHQSNSQNELKPDQPFAASYTVGANGRVVATQSGTTALILYIVSPTRVLVLDAGSNAPTLITLEQ